MHYIQQCIQRGRLEEASRLTRAWNLYAEFPDVGRMAAHRCLARMMDKKLWGVASTFAANDQALQTTLVSMLVLVRATPCLGP